MTSALVAGIFTLLGVALGSWISAAQTDRTVAVQRELAARQDMIAATSEFDDAITYQFNALNAAVGCWRSLTPGADRRSCETQITEYGKADLATQSAITKVAYFAPADAYNAAAELAEMLPQLDYFPADDSDLEAAAEVARNWPDFKILKQTYDREVCEAINPYGVDSCAGWRD